MTEQDKKLEVSKLCKSLDPSESGWVECTALESSLLECGYPPGQIQQMFDYADMTTDEGTVPILPFFVRLKRSGLMTIQSYRFQIGTQVLVRSGPDPRDWASGTVVQVHVPDPLLPRGSRLPYQVELHDGRITVVDEDDDDWCRKLTLPWWHQLHDQNANELAKASVGQNINDQQHDGVSFLHSAVSKRCLEVVAELLRLQADIDAIDKSHSTALHKAAMVPDSQTFVRMLCAAGADVNCQDLNPNYDPEFTSATFVGHDFEIHRTPLHYSSEGGDVNAMQILIEFQADVNVQDGDMNTPLHLAIQEGVDDAIDVLLRSAADVNLGNLESGSSSPLMCAAYSNNHDLARKLIESRADINKRGKSDMAALHLAARSGNATIARMLMTGRADPSLRSICGTAVDLATKKGNRELLEVLGVAKSQDDQHTGHTEGANSVALLDDARRVAQSQENVQLSGYTQGADSVALLDASQRAALFID